MDAAQARSLLFSLAVTRLKREHPVEFEAWFNTVKAIAWNSGWDAAYMAAQDDVWDKNNPYEVNHDG